MKSGLTYIIFVVDRSGSMQKIRNDMIGGFNSFIQAQRDANLGECRVFAYKFDTNYEPMFENCDLKHVPELDRISYDPRGNTALYDSLGKTIDDMGIKLTALPENERPEKVLVVTITDGENNSLLGNVEAKHFTLQEVKQKIEHQTSNYKWDFAYIGANQDAWSVGTSMGVSNNLRYAATSTGTAYAFGNLTKSATQYRAGGCGVTFAFQPDTQPDVSLVEKGKPVGKLLATGKKLQSKTKK